MAPFKKKISLTPNTTFTIKNEYGYDPLAAYSDTNSAPEVITERNTYFITISIPAHPIALALVRKKNPDDQKWYALFDSHPLTSSNKRAIISYCVEFILENPLERATTQLLALKKLDQEILFRDAIEKLSSAQEILSTKNSMFFWKTNYKPLEHSLSSLKINIGQILNDLNQPETELTLLTILDEHLTTCQKQLHDILLKKGIKAKSYLTDLEQIMATIHQVVITANVSEAQVASMH